MQNLTLDIYKNIGRAHCDLLINKICEVFNRQLLTARDSPIISALEYVREYLMKRIVIVQKIIQKNEGPLTPAITKIFNKIKESSTQYSVEWNRADQFQVKGPWGDQCVVNLENKTCSCRKWEISGIPCKHAVACIHDMADNGSDVGTPEDWVHDSYKLQTWHDVYSFKINPVACRQFWAKFKSPTTMIPPKSVPKIGRPTKKRKKSAGEIEMVKEGKLTRKGKTVTCSLCKGTGHNKRSCSARGQGVGTSQSGPSVDGTRTASTSQAGKKTASTSKAAKKSNATREAVPSEAASQPASQPSGSQQPSPAKN